MVMAAPVMRMASPASLLPRLPIFSTTRMQLLFRQFSLPLLPSLSLALPAGFQLGLPSIPSLLEGIWEGILKAVPKKKTSHMKKRHRQMAGKALKDVTSLCKCPACGELKRMHHLCPNCMSSEGTQARGRIGSMLTYHTELKEMMNKEAKEQAY